MKFWKKFDNPFLLAAEGFAAGALLFWVTAPDSAEAKQVQAPVSAASTTMQGEAR